MPTRTYVPGLKLAIEALRRYVSKYNNQLEKNTWSFLWAVAELLLDIAEVLLAVMQAQTPSGAPYDPDIHPDTSGYINQINGAFQKFIESVGAGAGV
jgi:hypothetical protein